MNLEQFYFYCQGYFASHSDVKDALFLTLKNTWFPQIPVSAKGLFYFTLLGVLQKVDLNKPHWQQLKQVSDSVTI